MPLHRFDHRDLLQQLGTVPPHQAAPIETIFVSTKGRSSIAEGLVRQLLPLGIPIVVMTSEVDDFPSINMYGDDLDIFIVRESRFEKNSPLLGHRFSRETVRHGNWDLHTKRNAAIAWSRANNRRRILLLDDDLEGITAETVQGLAEGLVSCRVAGALSTGALDNSIVSHLARSLGMPQSTFLSGNCMAIDVEKVTSTFPPIYNEDWLFMFDALGDRDVALAGYVTQLRVEALEHVELAPFQESGEIIAEGALAGLADGRNVESDIEFWYDYLRSRRELLTTMVNRFSKANDEQGTSARRALVAALSYLDNVLPVDCTSYLQQLRQHNERWVDMLESGSNEDNQLFDTVSIRPKVNRRSELADRQCLHEFWRYPDNATVTIVCPLLPQDMRSPLGNPADINYVPSQAMTDLDAAMEVYGHLRVLNPNADIRIRSCAELTPEQTSEHLILLGGMSWNSATRWFSELMDFPVKQLFGERTVGVPDYFEVPAGNETQTYRPDLFFSNGAANGHDIGFFVSAPNPMGRNRSIRLCSGVLGFGVLGVVRSMTNDVLGNSNLDIFIGDNDPEAVVCALMRVPVLNGSPLVTDISQPDNLLFHWSNVTDSEAI